jgi:mono/diheme cytochrome c family protein
MDLVARRHQGRRELRCDEVFRGKSVTACPEIEMRSKALTRRWLMHRIRNLVACVLLLWLPATAAAEEATKLARGKAILQDKCGRCHAVEETGESPLKIAPPMRDIYTRYAPRELQEELLEGKVSRHKEMPQIQFSHEDVDAILWYLYELAKPK